MVSTFAVPAMVYEDISPWTAIRRSTEAVGRTWGDYVVLKIGLAPIHLIIFLVVGFFAFVIAGAGALSGIYAPVGFGIAAFLIMCAHVLLQVTHTIYTTALYVYANTGALPRYFLGAPLAEAFASEPPSGRYAND